VAEIVEIRNKGGVFGQIMQSWGGMESSDAPFVVPTELGDHRGRRMGVEIVTEVAVANCVHRGR
jgi:hypothetical protein